MEIGTPRELPIDVVRTAASMDAFDVMPDGKRIVAVVAAGQSASPAPQIQIVLNWLEELKQRAPRAGR